jgi:CRP-like cAMP-binding protein
MPEISVTSRLKEILPRTPENDLELLAEICDLETFNDKEVILRLGNHWKKAFFILKGTVRGFVMNQDGLEQTILLRGKGIFVGDPQTLFSDVPQQLEIVSVGHSEILMFSFEEFEELTRRNKSIHQLYLNGLKEAVLRLMYRIKGMITLTAEERYKKLMEMNPAFLEHSYDKYIASYLGITPVSLSRIKKKLNLEN